MATCFSFIRGAKRHPNFVSLRLVSHNCEEVILFQPNLSPNGVKKKTLAKCTSLTSPLVRHINKQTRTSPSLLLHILNHKLIEQWIHGVIINTIAVRGRDRRSGVRLIVTQLSEIISFHNCQVISHDNIFLM